jgi:hypothetical protein
MSLFTNATRNFRDRSEKIFNFAFNRRRRGSRFSRAQAIDAFTGAWLENRYGWRTTWYDAQDAFKAFTRKKRNFIRAYGLVGDSYNSVRTSLVGSSSGYYTVTKTTPVHATVKAGVTYQILLDVLSRVSINPALTAWELVPYSFVADWFIDVGNTLAAFAWNPNLVEYASYYNETYEVSSISIDVVLDHMISGYESISYSAPEITGTYRYVNRQPTSFISFARPRIEVNLSPAKMVDSLALLQQSKFRILSRLARTSF